MTVNLVRDEVDGTIREALDSAGLSYESPAHGQFLVRLEGQHKLVTMCWLVAGDHALLVEAFVMRRPEENHEQLYRLLLGKNTHTYGVSWAVDSLGDVYLVGRIDLHAVTGDEIDRLLGAVLTYADSTFDAMLEIGYGSAIRREWAWREKNGESLANLKAFARFADPARVTAVGH